MKKLRQELAELRSNRIEEEEAERAVFAAPDDPAAASAAAEKPEGVNALDVIEFRMVERREDAERPGFAPAFAHQHFEEERIVGFENLHVTHWYAADTLLLHTRVSFSAKSLPCSDVEGSLRQYMPDAEVESEREWSAQSLDELLERAEKERREWQPPGSVIFGYRKEERAFQVRHGNVSDPKVRRYLQRARPFLIWFVDAANFIDDTDPKWDVFFLFREPTRPGEAFVLCGFATSYSFFSWAGRGLKLTKDGANSIDSSSSSFSEPRLERFLSAQSESRVLSEPVETLVASWISRSYLDGSPSALPWYERRFRVSQFLVLPPHQRAGHGARLFEAMCGWAKTAYAPLRDITVEDPSPSFVAMRDYCDLAFLVERGLLRAQSTRGHDLEAIREMLAKERHVCGPQIARVVDIVRWLEAYGADSETRNSLRREIKKKLLKENSADMPEEPKALKQALEDLWLEEEASYNATLLRLHLIN